MTGSSVVDRPRPAQAEQAVGENSGTEEKQTRERKTVKVDSLKPNPVNSATFTESLAEESIKSLAENIERNHGLRQPIEITESGMILDGERRWKAVKLLGWSEVEVTVVPGIDSDEAIAAFVFDAFDANRKTNVEEKVNLYKLAIEVLTTQHGRAQGRPKKGTQHWDGFWKPEKIRDEAAKRSGLGSKNTAEKAKKVFTEGDADLLAKVNSGEVSISAAYNVLVAPAKKKPGKKLAATASSGPETKERGNEAEPHGGQDTPVSDADAGEDPVEDSVEIEQDADTNTVAASGADTTAADGAEASDNISDEKPDDDLTETEDAIEPEDEGTDEAGDLEPEDEGEPEDDDADTGGADDQVVDGEDDASGNQPAGLDEDAVIRFARSAPSDEVIRVIEAMAEVAYLDVWIAGDDLIVNIETLGDKVANHLGMLAAQKSRTEALEAARQVAQKFRNAMDES